MFKTLLIKEIREIIGSSKFIFLFSVSSVLILSAFFMGAKNFQLSQTQYEAATKENFRKMEGITDWSRMEPQIFLPPKPLASLVSGVSNDIGRLVAMNGASELIPDNTRYGEDPIYAAFRFMDLDFIFQIILSLFAILLAYNAVNGEKEQGTLKLTFANPVPKDVYILAKLTGSFTAIALPMLVPMLIGCFLLLIMGIPLSQNEWVCLALILISGLLYFSIFLNLSIYVSSKVEKSANAFLFLLIAWIFLVLIIPRTAVLITGRTIEVPSVDEINSQKYRFQSQLWSEHFQQMSTFKPTESEPDKIFTEFNQFMGKLNDEREKKGNEFNERLNEDRRNRQDVQRRWSFVLARISPASVYSFCATNLAGTSNGLADRFLNAVKEYKSTFSNFIQSKTGRKPSGFRMVVRTDDDENAKPKPINPHELPVFEMLPQSLSETVSTVLMDFGHLALFNLVFFAAAVFSFQRFDVR